MRSRSDSDSGFRGFLNFSGTAPKAAIILIIGFLLLLLGGREISVAGDVTEETKIAEMCSVTAGVGECRVMVTYSPEDGGIYAVAVLCDGADSAEVRSRITEMLCSLYGIGSHRVSVLKLEK